jgi:nicotinate-nucleotide adenylyltransferase
VRLGIFGGTFDPVHLGHLLLAEQCREQCELDAVWFVPAGSPPHKSVAELTPGQVRAEMLDLAVAGRPEFAVNRMELDRPGRSFTIDTLEELKAADPDRELYFIVGADSLADLPTWREPRRILELATLLVANRGDRPLPGPESLQPELGGDALERIRIVTMPAVDFSASDIRNRVRTGRSIRYLVPRAVEAYIEQHGLYRPK